MTAILENDSYCNEFAKKARTSRLAGSTPDAGVMSDDLMSPLHVFSWSHEGEPTRRKLTSSKELSTLNDTPWDLRIIMAERDSPDKLPYLPMLCKLVNIPSQFISESLKSVTHSFGHQHQERGIYTSWLHLLTKNPSLPTSNTDGGWLRPAFVLTHSEPDQDVKCSVTLTCFEPPEEFVRTVLRLHQSKSYHDILAQPYLLYIMIFEAWFNVIDANAWKVLDMVRDTEEAMFLKADRLASRKPKPLAINYSNVHKIAKEVFHQMESVNATLRCLNSMKQMHSHLVHVYVVSHNIVHDELNHILELFWSTHIRLASIDQRLNNIINLAFNIRSMADSDVVREDSYIMKTLAIVAMIFLPISTISSIFGMQFFSSAQQPDSSGAITTVSPQFWIFWCVAIPFTTVIVLVWAIWVKRFRRKITTGDLEMEFSAKAC